MSLPKVIYVVRRKNGNDEAWFDAGTNKLAQVEDDGDVVGTYRLVAEEKGKQLVQFTPVK